MDKNKQKKFKYQRKLYNKKRSKLKDKPKLINYNNERLGLIPKNHAYHKPPDKLDAFPDAMSAVKSKNYIQGSRKNRAAWEENKYIYLWDSRHGTVEKYSKKTKEHLGEFDPLTGELMKKPNPRYKLLN